MKTFTYHCNGCQNQLEPEYAYYVTRRNIKDWSAEFKTKAHEMHLCANCAIELCDRYQLTLDTKVDYRPEQEARDCEERTVKDER